MYKAIKVLLLVAVLMVALSGSVVASHDYVPNGIMNKFYNGFVDCFQGIDKSCHQFDYDKDGTVGFGDFGTFIGKYTKMVK